MNALPTLLHRLASRLSQGLCLAAWLMAGSLLPLGAVAATVYTYDELNRLTQVVYDDGRSITYTYDPAGNLTKTVSSGNPRDAALVGYWRFDSCTGADSSAANRPAVISGSTCVDAHAGKGFKFNNGGYNVSGGTDWVALPAYSGGEVTFSAWVKWNGDASSGNEYAGALWSLGVHTQNPFLSVWVNEGTGKIWTDRYTTSPYRLAPGVWAMVTIASNGLNEALYLNGELLNLATLPSPVNFTGQTGYIARHFWASGNAARFRGVVDEARMYSRALSAAEVQSLYAEESGQGGFAGLAKPSR